MASLLPDTMLAVLLTGHGGFEALAVREDVAVPRPGAGEVLIRVGAAGVNNTDINTRIGWYATSGTPERDGGWTGAPLAFPRIQGADACGTVVALGEGVAAARLGARVLVEPCFRAPDGGIRYFGLECDGAFGFHPPMDKHRPAPRQGAAAGRLPSSELRTLKLAAMTHVRSHPPTYRHRQPDRCHTVGSIATHDRPPAEVALVVLASSGPAETRMDSSGPETERLIAAAGALAPLVAEHRAALARGPDLPASIAEALHAAGLTQLWLPRAYGGSELPPADYIRVIEAVARLDGAVGWCAAIASSGSRLAGLLPRQAAGQMFGPERRSLSGSVNPAGTAVPTDGGFRVSGRWSWGSFIRHSDWTLGMCRMRDGEGPPALLAAIAPTASITIHDTWDAGGLRATGSHDFEFAEVFVPAERTIPLPGFVASPHDPGPLYGLPFVTVFTLGITPVALGIARASIDALVATAARKTPAGTTSALREQPGVQRDVAIAEAKLRSARAFLFEAVDAFWVAAQRGRAADMRLRADVRLACWNVAEACRQVVGLMFEAAGGSAVDNRQPFAACLRDVSAAGQHLAFAQRNLEVVGRVLLGMDAGTARF